MDGKIFEKLIEVSECAFFISKPGGEMEITYASKKFYSILQYTKEEFQEKFKNSLMAVILPEEKQKVKNLIARQFAAGGAVNIDYRMAFNFSENPVTYVGKQIFLFLPGHNKIQEQC